MSKNESVQPAVAKKSASERFTQAVVKEFEGSVGKMDLTPYQQKLINNYFIKLDQSLALAETKRMKTPEDKRESLSYTWENININALAMQVVPLASVGLDPLQPNHVNLIPYKNNHTNKFDITPIIGYRGLALKAIKYGLDSLEDVIVELVYANDKFKLIKKDANNSEDTYLFEVVNPFDRGELIGGFYCQKYHHSKSNRIRVFTKADIEKRKPKYASAEFWGGEKDAWQGGKKVGKEKVEGWYDEMAYKTIYRAAYNDIIIDSQKIDAQFAELNTIKDEFNHEPANTTEDVKHEVVEDTAKETLVFFADEPIQLMEMQAETIGAVKVNPKPDF